VSWVLSPRCIHPNRSYVLTCLNMGLGMPCRPLRTNCVFLGRPHTEPHPVASLAPSALVESGSYPTIISRDAQHRRSLGHASNVGQRAHAVLSIAHHSTHHTLASFREMPCVSGTCWATGTCGCGCGCCDAVAVSTPVAPPVEAGAGKLPSIS